jgi:hypothetical protein
MKNSSDKNSAEMKTKSGSSEKGAANDMNKGANGKRSTNGQGAAAGSAKLSTQQRTKITTVIKNQHVTRIEPSKLNVSIRIGARIPTSVHFYPLPTEVVTVYPEWRGYDYILVGEQIIILDPGSHEIVYILPA